jgi:hypothetical protein
MCQVLPFVSRRESHLPPPRQNFRVPSPGLQQRLHRRLQEREKSASEAIFVPIQVHLEVDCPVVLNTLLLQMRQSHITHTARYGIALVAILSSISIAFTGTEKHMHD